MTGAWQDINQLEANLEGALEQLIYMERDLTEIRAARIYQRLIFTKADPPPTKCKFAAVPLEVLMMAEEGFQAIYDAQLKLIATELATFTFSGPLTSFTLTIDVTVKSKAENAADAQLRNFDYPHEPWRGPGEPFQSDMEAASDAKHKETTTEDKFEMLKAAIRHGGVSVKELQIMLEAGDE